MSENNTKWRLANRATHRPDGEANPIIRHQTWCLELPHGILFKTVYDERDDEGLVTRNESLAYVPGIQIADSGQDWVSFSDFSNPTEGE